MAMGKKRFGGDEDGFADAVAPAGEDGGFRPQGEVTVIAPGARLEGVLVSGGSLRVEGEVKGEIRAEGDVTIARSASVEADVHAQSLRIEGRFTGNVDVASRAEMGGTAQVTGNITCATLVIAEGAVFNGQTTMSKGAPVISLSEAPEPAKPEPLTQS